MISRRDFLKISGLSTIAAASGFGAGKLFGSSGQKILRVQAFVPDASAAAEITQIISRSAGSIVVSGDQFWKDLISEAFHSNMTESNGGKLIVKTEKLGHNIQGDILLSDNSTSIYDPENDFNGRLIQLRARLKKNYSGYRYTAFYDNESLLNSLLKSGTCRITIEDENGIYDQLKLSGTEKLMVIKGPSGKTGIEIKDNIVSINSACCRNRLCKTSGPIKYAGDMLACAPNKVLVRIDRV
jgi:hypothetical protein